MSCRLAVVVARSSSSIVIDIVEITAVVVFVGVVMSMVTHPFFAKKLSQRSLIRVVTKVRHSGQRRWRSWGSNPSLM